MTDKRWKKHELKTAEALGGERIPITGRQRGSAPDVAHDALSIECKQRQVIPKWINEAMEQAQASIKSPEQVPIVVIHGTGMKYEDDYVMLTMKDFKKIRWWDD